MILYLARNENVNLFDTVAIEKSLRIRKLSGSFSLSEFIVMEMRKFASCQYFCVERTAITENDINFVEALQSFQMMYGARVIIIHEWEGRKDTLTRELMQIGITDIVTASDINEKMEQLAECLSNHGMLKYKPAPATVTESNDNFNDIGRLNTVDKFTNDSEYHQFDESYDYDKPNHMSHFSKMKRESLASSIPIKDVEEEHYRFDCVNVKIGIIGATRRVGTTTIALGLANYIKNHGGTACYVALNTNQHLESIANAYSFDTEDDYYTCDTIDFYEGILPSYDYNFIIIDFGDVKREAVRKYKESDLHLLCGASNKPFEIFELSEAFKQVKSVKPQIFTYSPTPKHNELFNSIITQNHTTIKPTRNMLDFKINEHAYMSIIKQYIVEISKRL